MKLLTTKISSWRRFNDALEVEGLPRVNVVVVAGSVDGSGATRTDEVVVGEYQTASWGALNKFRQVDRNNVMYVNKRTGQVQPGVVVYEYIGHGDAHWPDEYVVAVAPLPHADVIRQRIEEAT